MRKINKLLFLAAIGMFALSGCDSSGGTSQQSSSEPAASSSAEDEGKIKSDSLYVEKVEGLPDNFFKGMDISSLLSLEAGGTKFYDFDGKEADLLKVIADNGVNLARVRVWNDPFDADGKGYGGGNCNIDTAVEIGKRATANGVGLLVDFHYSDFWADPGRQTAPKAWKDYTVDQKAEALYTYTVESLNKLKAAKVDVPMVQVGNETNGFSLAGEKGIESFAKLANKGYQAVKEVYPNALVALHFTNPEKRNYDFVCKQLHDNNVNYDVFGSSYYPFFHGTLSNLRSQLRKATEYGKKVMVLETQYAFTSEDTDQCGNQFSEESSYKKDYPISVTGQATNYRNVCETVAGITDAGIGVCYWEGAWITASPQKAGEEDGAHWERLEKMWSDNGSGWASKYAYQYDVEAPQPTEWGHWSAGSVVDNMAFFDKNGKPVESLKVFNLIKYGNTDVPEFLDGVGTGKATVKLDEVGSAVLPETVDGIYNNGNLKPLPVVWQNKIDDEDGTKIADIKTPGTYVVKGTVTVGEKTYNTECALTITASNYVKNGDFEKGDDGTWTVTNLKGDEFVGGNYYALITKENDNNPISGVWDVHSFTKTQEIEFKVEQELAKFEADATLKLSYATTGGAKNEITKETASSCMELYAYLLEDGVQIAKVPGYVTAWGNKYTFDVSNIAVKAGKTYIVGVYAKLNIGGANPEFWIDIDDVNLFA